MTTVALPHTVTHSQWEQMFCGEAGLLRQILAVGANKQRQFESPDPWQDHIFACMAEYGVSKALDLTWFGVFTNEQLVQADVGEDIQVRQTPLARGGLIVRQRDIDKDKGRNQRYVLVISDIPRFHIVGWRYLNEIVTEANFCPANAKGPAYWYVAQADLWTEPLAAKRPSQAGYQRALAA